MTFRPNTFHEGDARYQVVGAAVVAKLGSGQEAYVYRNGLLPLSTTPSHVEHLLSLGLIQQLADAEPAAPAAPAAKKPAKSPYREVSA